MVIFEFKKIQNTVNACQILKFFAFIPHSYYFFLSQCAIIYFVSHTVYTLIDHLLYFQN